MGNEELAMRAWIEQNLAVTTATLSKEVVCRWRRLLKKDQSTFYTLALFGFVRCRTQDEGHDCYPETEFMEFCAEFLKKISLAEQGLGAKYALPLFRRVGFIN